MPDATFADLFSKWREGEGAAKEAIFSQYLDDLTAIAQGLMRRERAGGAVSISTGDLVGETMLRLLSGKPVEPIDMHHLMALSASAMRRFLVDRARARHAGKRRGMRVTLNEELIGTDARPIELLAVDEALNTLDQVAPDRAQAFEMYFYAGMTHEEIGNVLDVSRATAQRYCTAAAEYVADLLNRD